MKLASDLTRLVVNRAGPVASSSCWAVLGQLSNCLHRRELSVFIFAKKRKRKEKKTGAQIQPRAQSWSWRSHQPEKKNQGAEQRQGMRRDGEALFAMRLPPKDKFPRNGKNSEELYSADRLSASLKSVSCFFRLLLCDEEPCVWYTYLSK